MQKKKESGEEKARAHSAQKLIEARRAMQMVHGEEYPERIEQFKVYVLATMSRCRCDETVAVNRIAGVLHETGRLSGLTLAMLEAAAVEIIAQSASIFSDASGVSADSISLDAAHV